jgi:hypothetical protein
MNTSTGFLCGKPDGWGKERLCKSCDERMRAKWDEEDRLRDINKNKGGV